MVSHFYGFSLLQIIGPWLTLRMVSGLFEPPNFNESKSSKRKVVLEAVYWHLCCIRYAVIWDLPRRGYFICFLLIKETISSILFSQNSFIALFEDQSDDFLMEYLEEFYFSNRKFLFSNVTKNPFWPI